MKVSDRTLFIGAEAHSELAAFPNLTGWQPHKAHADSWQRAGFRLVEATPNERWPVVLVLPGRSRDEILATFAMARDHLAEGGTLVAAMKNTTGAGRFEKELKKATLEVISIQKNKCRVFSATDGGNWDESLFAEWRELGALRKIPDTEFTVCAGIFSSDHVDPGSKLLVDNLPLGLNGKVADLGAGWGYLSAAALQRCPKIRRIDLYESDARALDCARLNVTSDECELNFRWQDVRAGLAESYDAIIMNPPFHAGRPTDVELGRTFLKTAVASLKKGGELYVVANRQLPYEAVLDASELVWSRFVEDQTYKILTGRKS
jgi:16S rRNA (guanine1207-N2)-methyltransferase